LSAEGRVILIADDDPSDAHFLRLALEETRLGLRIHDVGDGQEAVDYLAGNGKYRDRESFPFPAHLILDLKLPRLSGFEVLRWLRGREDIGGLPVTVLSGSQLPGDIQQVAALGAEYLVKPVEYAELKALVRELCRRAGFG
jgi:DNA-binding response OmpR family regulator